MVGISQLFPSLFSFNGWLVFFIALCLAGENGLQISQEQNFRLRKMALLLKCLPCMHEDPGLGSLNPSRKLGGCGHLSIACCAGK